MSDLSSLSNCRPPSCKGTRTQSLFKVWPSGQAELAPNFTQCWAARPAGPQMVPQLAPLPQGRTEPRYAGPGQTEGTDLSSLEGKQQSGGACASLTLPG